MSLTLIKKTGLFDTFLLKCLCAHTKSCTFAPEKEKRIKDYGNVRDNDSSCSSIRSSCLRRYEPRNELRQISYEAKRA